MMGSSIIESEMEQSNDYYVENTVFVAVGKQVEESESVLMWAAEKFAKKKMICILHIHQPAHIVTLCEPSFFLNFFFCMGHLKLLFVSLNFGVFGFVHPGFIYE